MLCTAINAVTLALIDAGVPMKEFVCACTAGFIDGTAVLGKFWIIYYWVFVIYLSILFW